MFYLLKRQHISDMSHLSNQFLMFVNKLISVHARRNALFSESIFKKHDVKSQTLLHRNVNVKRSQ